MKPQSPLKRTRIRGTAYLVATATTPFEIVDEIYIGDYLSRKEYLAAKRQLMADTTMAFHGSMGLAWRTYGNLTPSLRNEVNK